MKGNYNEEIDQENGMEEPFINKNSSINNNINNNNNKSLGGARTLPFILANDGFERAAFYGLQPNMILYLMGAYGLSMATGSNIIFLWSAATNVMPILAAFLADAYVGRFWMIGFGSVSTLMGMVLLWSTTIIPGVRPSSGDTASDASSSSTLPQLVYLCFSFGLMSIGSGGIRSSALAFGADQVTGDEHEKSKPEGSQALASLFNWYYFSVSVSMLVALTGIVYIQDHLGWQVGFAIPVSLMLVSTFSFYVASSFYIKEKPVASAFSRLAQVVIASWRNRYYKFSSQTSSEPIYHVAKGSVLEVPSQKLRFLNKACVVKDPTLQLNLDEMVLDPWCLCTTDQVEELKSIMKTIPLWSTGIILSVNSSSLSPFTVLQAESMERHLFKSSSFEIPSASLGTFGLFSIMIWLVLYDRVLTPLASKMKGKSSQIDATTRMGIGLLLSASCMLVAGVVEHIRRGSALAPAAGNVPTLPMSVWWLLPQVILQSLGDCIMCVAQIEFFYSEFPKSMSSISSNLFGLCCSVGSLLASLILTGVNYITKQDGKEGWVSNDPNKGHYDYYCWVLAGLGLLNFVYFLLCGRAYKEEKRVSEERMNTTNGQIVV